MDVRTAVNNWTLAEHQTYMATAQLQNTRVDGFVIISYEKYSVCISYISYNTSYVDTHQKP